MRGSCDLPSRLCAEVVADCTDFANEKEVDLEVGIVLILTKCCGYVGSTPATHLGGRCFKCGPG
jgi:hypothetical protein